MFKPKKERQLQTCRHLLLFKTKLIVWSSLPIKKFCYNDVTIKICSHSIVNTCTLIWYKNTKNLVTKIKEKQVKKLGGINLRGILFSITQTDKFYVQTIEQ